MTLYFPPASEFNLKNRLVSLPSLTTKDYQDLDFAVSEELDFLALSFVQSSSDVRFLKQALAERGASIPVIAKIERKNALDDIQNIVRECYGIMVARGDLALEMSFEDVPIAQKRIITVCRDEGVPVITATQMLESMINFHKPTRAEAADIANAILDGTDAVMLSAESAVGRFPVEAVATMATIAARAEEAWITGELPIPPSIPDRADLEAAVGHAAHAIANSVTAKAIIAATASGGTPRRVSCHRPKMPILALCSSKEVCRRLALSWGVRPMLYEPVAGTAHLVRLSVDAATKVLEAKPEDVLTIVAGTPYNMPGKTNLIKVEKISDALRAEHGEVGRMTFFTASLAPSPTATIAMSAATPMKTPSTVRAERSLFRPIACAAAARTIIVKHKKGPAAPISAPLVSRLWNSAPAMMPCGCSGSAAWLLSSKRMCPSRMVICDRRRQGYRSRGSLEKRRDVSPRSLQDPFYKCLGLSPRLGSSKILCQIIRKVTEN